MLTHRACDILWFNATSSMWHEPCKSGTCSMGHVLYLVGLKVGKFLLQALNCKCITTGKKLFDAETGIGRISEAGFGVWVNKTLEVEVWKLPNASCGIGQFFWTRIPIEIEWNHSRLQTSRSAVGVWDTTHANHTSDTNLWHCQVGHGRLSSLVVDGSPVPFFIRYTYVLNSCKAIFIE